MPDQYEHLRKIISQSDWVDFAEFGDGIDDALLVKGDAFFGTKLPKSYRWWLKNYSGGNLGMEEIYSLYEEGESKNFSGGDIRHMYQIDINRDPDNKYRIMLFEPSGWDEVYYFKLSDNNLEDWPVYVADPGLNNEKVFASNFAGFLTNLIETYE